MSPVPDPDPGDLGPADRRRDRGGDSEPATSDVAYAAAVAMLHGMTPQRLALILHGRDAAEVWHLVRSAHRSIAELLGTLPTFASPEGSTRPSPSGIGPDDGAARRRRPQDPAATARSWAEQARSVEVGATWRDLRNRQIAVVRYGGAGYPLRLLEDDAPPELLFVRGDLAVAFGAAAAIVGTRRATHYGLEIAAEIGVELARAGVCVVSGLAIGIDARAHEGALALRDGAPPLAVTGGGVDVVYPIRNRHLADRLADRGALVSEAPPGAAPEPWRFPMRNRIIAALSQTVVIVESTLQGGAMHTVEAALSRGLEVFAVPGSVRSPVSEGTNELLAAGAHVARDAADVLAEIERRCVQEGIALPSGAGRPGAQSISGRGGPRSSDAVARALAGCTSHERDVYSAVGENPTAIDLVCERTSLGLGACALALDHLAELGLVRPADGAWRRA